jgi:hypothetical protein
MPEEKQSRQQRRQCKSRGGNKHASVQAEQVTKTPAQKQSRQQKLQPKYSKRCQEAGNKDKSVKAEEATIT